MKQSSLGGMNYGSEKEDNIRIRFAELFKNSPIPSDNIIPNLGLFLNSKVLSRLLFMDFLYRQAVEVQGVIMDFGTRWGQNMSFFAALILIPV